MTEAEAGAPDIDITARGTDAGRGGEDVPVIEEPTTAGPRRPWRQALWADMKGAIPDATASLVLTGVILAVLWWRVENDRSQTIELMPTLATMDYFPYFALQAFGWSALVWSWGTVILGLLVAGGRPGWLEVKTRTLEKLHRTTSLTVMALTLVHILLMTWSRTFNDRWSVARSLWETLVLFGWSGTPTGRWAIGVGLVAFYLAIILGLSYYVRHVVGVRAWRYLHRFSILVYVLAVWHTFIYGTNVWFTGWQRTLLWAMQLPIAYMFIARLLKPLRKSERLPLTPGGLAPRLGVMTVLRLGVRVVAAATIVVLVGILALDRTGGHDRPEHYPTEAMQRGEGHGG